MKRIIALLFIALFIASCGVKSAPKVPNEAAIKSYSDEYINDYNTIKD